MFCSYLDAAQMQIPGTTATKLHCIWRCKREVARVPLEHGADANAGNVGSWTPLHGTSKGGHLNAVRILLKHGAAANAWRIGTWTTLQFASKGGYLPARVGRERSLLARIVVDEHCD
jgi:ankyrin repeat protein